jgi:hypothetical protein
LPATVVARVNLRASGTGLGATPDVKAHAEDAKPGAEVKPRIHRGLKQPAKPAAVVVKAEPEPAATPAPATPARASAPVPTPAPAPAPVPAPAAPRAEDAALLLRQAATISTLTEQSRALEAELETRTEEVAELADAVVAMQADIDALRQQPDHELHKSLMRRSRELGRLLAAERAAVARARKAEEEQRRRADAAEAELAARGIDVGARAGGAAGTGAGAAATPAKKVLLPGESEDRVDETSAEVWKVRVMASAFLMHYLHVVSVLTCPVSLPFTC